MHEEGSQIEARNGRGSISVLDNAQLRRITAEHRGFVYQHLYAAGCLLHLEATAAQSLLVERDEDLEIVLPDRRLYLQVKMRSNALGWSDIRGAVEQFDKIRKEHTEGRRSGIPALTVITNATPGPRLMKKIQSASWPADVALLWPGGPQTQDTWLPPPQQDITGLLQWCVEEAGRVPFGSLDPQTLVWKLAARVQYACTGAHDHSFQATDLPELCEQFVKDLQTFPEAPDVYRPQEGEPPLIDDQRVRLVVGFAGAGKTTWAAQAATHCPMAVTYFDVSALPSETVPGALARELAARHLSPNAEAVRLPSGPGLDVLRAVHLRLADERIAVAVVLDNVHQLPTADIRALVEALPTARLIMLGHPWPELALLEAQLAITAESLRGWSADTVVAAFASEGCTLNYATAQRILALTGGLPLYVLNAAFLTRTTYARDGSAFSDALQELTHIVPTAQEIILDKVFEHLNATASTLAGLLAIAEVPLTRTELQQLTTAAGLDRPTANARALRELASHGLTQTFTDGHIKLHDAARTRAAACADDLTEEVTGRIFHALAELLDGEGDLARLSRWMRLLARIGRTDILVDIATTDYFHESGYPTEIREVLNGLAQDPSQDAGTRFDALDALLYWAYMDGDWDAYAHHLRSMETVFNTGKREMRDAAVVAAKQFLLHGHLKDVPALTAAFTTALAALPAPSQRERILRYNYAAALYQADHRQAAIDEAMLLASAYASLLHLTPEILFDGSTAQLSAALSPVEDCYEDVKRMADCLALVIRHDRDQGEASFLSLPTMDLYLLAGAWRSAVEIGQDAADYFLERGDITAALTLIEQQLLPIASEHNLSEMILRVRSQRAVILAFAGDIAAARAEIDAVKQYDLTPRQRDEVTNQKGLIEQIASSPMYGSGKTQQ
ncbi:hypothetical protein ACFY5H_34350 [Streptomyces sp. NPDC013012]|uniref:hypothetical protein n=1 Tax=Streptomyces sp. NPDC013012 TaxID=3364860 RepID=UPI003698099A